MTDKKSEIPPIVQASATDKSRAQERAESASAETGVGSASSSGSRSDSGAAPDDGPGFGPGSGSDKAGNVKKRAVLTPVLIVLVLASAGFTFHVWQQQRQALSANVDLSAQLQRSVNAANQAAERAQQALSKVQDQAGQIALLETSLRDAMENQQALEQAFQTLTDKGSDLVLINDIDHLVTIAQQQLLLGGNVANAIISMETAQSQLARANRPSLAALQQTINGDLERLRAASTIDVAKLSGQLDVLNRLLADAPLLLPDDAAPDVNSEQATQPDSQPAKPQAEPSAVPADAAWWEKSWHVANDWTRAAWGSVAHELTQLISVRRVDDSSALLMSPEQSARFRDNLRLRVMTAQLALMMRQASVWELETKTLLTLISGRFDPQSTQFRQALKIAQDLADTSIAVNLPRVDNSLRAIESLREENANARQEQDSETNEPDAQTQLPAPASNDSVMPDGETGDPVEPSVEHQAPEQDDNVEQGDDATSIVPTVTEPSASHGGQEFVLNTEGAVQHAVRAVRFVQQG